MNGETSINPSGEFEQELTDSLLLSKAEQEKPESSYVLQTPQEFRDDFVKAVSNATHQVGLETMQFEVCDDTLPIFEAMKHARQRGVADVRFHYDRVALTHIRSGKAEAAVYKGRTLPRTFKKNERVGLIQANVAREQLVAELEAIGVTSSNNKERGKYEHGSHNHVKLAIVDDVAWIGTMNLRETDFAMSNFMLKITDPQWVEKLKEVFEQTEEAELGSDRTIEKNNEEPHDTQLLLDSGVKEQSIIYDKAVEMAESLGEGDEFIMISQWPPVEKMMFGDLMSKLVGKMRQGAKGTFLMSPAEDLHFIKTLSPLLQSSIEKKQRKTPNMQAKNLARKTHAKAFVIKRASGEVEVLFGSHNFTSFTVKNGTRELAMYSKDPEITAQIVQFLEKVQSE